MNVCSGNILDEKTVVTNLYFTWSSAVCVEFSLRCEFCGTEETLPFRCNYCKKFHCAEHRLPENHNCPDLWMAKKPVEAPPPAKLPIRRRLLDPGWLRDYRITYTAQPRRIAWFTPTELQHLAIGAVLVLAVGLTALRLILPLWALVVAALIVAGAFIIHELGHKFVAQNHGLWAEFRVNPLGVVLTVISIFSPFKIIAPGAVVIAGPATLDVIGRVSLIGPVTNLLMGGGFLLLTFVTHSVLYELAFIGAYINGILAVFNLLPLGILDGHKIFLWNKRAWTIAFIAAISLLAFTFL